MAKSLVIVESPAKARTINKYLGQGFIVYASGGHIMDLPRKKMGVDVEKDFSPEYVVIPARKKIVTQIKKEAKEAEKVFLAADPDREGEAICWHIQQCLKTKARIYRVSIHEITEGAVKEAFAHPGALDEHKIEAQQTRRVLDRLVGYNLSPLLWKKITRGLSAGRVQSVAVRLVVEREREIGHFIPQEYWDIEAKLKKKGQAKTPFTAKLVKVNGKAPVIENKEEADTISEKIGGEEFEVSDVQQRQRKRAPQAPYTTSKLQQEAFNQLRFPVGKTMRVAQQLYEGLELGKEGSVGLITYMRTDSVRVSKDAVKACRDYIGKNFAKEYLPDKPVTYKSKKTAQEAHEAIRPALPLRHPETVKDFLTPEQYKLYRLIWNKFISSQMAPATYAIRTVLITAGGFLFKTVATILKFDGFLKVHNPLSEDKRPVLPELDKGEKLDLVKLISSQHFTQPPPRFSDASLVKTLEEKGIGRPSTYAPTIRTIVYRDYVRRNKGYFFATELGFTVNDLLIKYFPKILNLKFTALLEADLDEIEEGKLDSTSVLKLFYEPFIEELAVAQKEIKKEDIPTKEICEVCNRPMVMKWGRHGRFLSCSGFPDCKHSRSITTEINCPQEGCEGRLIERRTKRGRLFYGCSKYPECKYAANKLPGTEPAPPSDSETD